MSTEEHNIVCRCDCVRCKATRSSTGTTSNTTSHSQCYRSLSDKYIEKIPTNPKPATNGSIIASTTQKEHQRNASESQTSTTDLENTMHADFNTSHPNIEKSEIFIDLNVDCTEKNEARRNRAVNAWTYFNHVAKVSLLQTVNPMHIFLYQMNAFRIFA
jgi:hypothetical protein